MNFTKDVLEAIDNVSIDGEEELTLEQTKGYAEVILYHIKDLGSTSFNTNYFMTSLAQLIKGVKQNN